MSKVGGTGRGPVISFDKFLPKKPNDGKLRELIKKMLSYVRKLWIRNDDSSKKPQKFNATIQPKDGLGIRHSTFFKASQDLKRREEFLSKWNLDVCKDYTWERFLKTYPGGDADEVKAAWNLLKVGLAADYYVATMLAYRLSGTESKGQIINIPSSSGVIVEYKVDKVFIGERGLAGYALLPTAENSPEPPRILFRGTHKSNTVLTEEGRAVTGVPSDLERKNRNARLSKKEGCNNSMDCINRKESCSFRT